MNNNKINAVKAVYSEQKVYQYKGNPLIEALPDIIDDPSKLEMQLTKYPIMNEADLELPAMYRIHLVKNIENFFKPLSIHYTTEQVISRMLRNGYVHRNPVKQRKEVADYDWQKYPCEDVSQSTTPELGMFGISGIGKTTLFKNILSMYPKVILHTNYKGDTTVRYQITWLSVQTPSNGSPKSLCLNLLSQIDEIFGDNRYYKRGAVKATDELPEYIRTVVKVHSIGLIIFDELQNLSGLGGKAEEKLLNFFVELSNTIEVPMIMIGTLKALPLFKEFRNTRRICSEETIIWNRIENDEEWKAFVKDLFNFQWTKNPVQPTDDLMDYLYYESQGITDIAVKLFMLAQYRAISTNYEKITKNIIGSVAKDSLKLLKPMLDALRSGNKDDLIKYGDIYLKKEYWDNLVEQEKGKVLLFGNNDKSNETLENNNEFTKNNKISAITAWLVQGGFTLQESQSTAKEIVSEYGASTDINILNRHAYQSLVSKVDMKKEEKKLKEKNEANKKPPSGMLKVFGEAIKSKKSIYEALKEADFIAEYNEFVC